MANAQRGRYVLECAAECNDELMKLMKFSDPGQVPRLGGGIVETTKSGSAHSCTICSRRRAVGILLRSCYTTRSSVTTAFGARTKKAVSVASTETAATASY